MSGALFDQLEATLQREGAGAAIDRLCQALRASRDYNALFYALLMKKRHELGVNPVPTGPAQDLPAADDARQYFIRALVRALYAELRGRLTAEIEGRFGIAPAGADAPPDTPGVIRQLLEGRDWLFADEAYHIDTSHLSSVVQMS